jgi:hypothetical protein
MNDEDLYFLLFIISCKDDNSIIKIDSRSFVYLNMQNTGSYMLNKMRFIKEPEGVDFVIQSKPLSKKQEKELSEYIAKRKLEIKKLTKKGTMTRPKF